MSVRQRAGRWTLDETAEGVFVVKKGGQFEAKIVTDVYDPDAGAGDETSGVLGRVIEVDDFGEAREAFFDYVREKAVPGLDR